MKFTFIANACSIVEHDGFRILTDPWLEDGVFEGSWYHYPPLKTRFESLPPLNAIYISHLHPDHFDKRFMNRVDRKTPIIVLDHEPNFLIRLLRSDGFNNLITIKDGASASLGPFTLTMYAPFDKHVFHDAEIGYLIDSALVIDSHKHAILNTNDNTPSLRKAAELRARHEIDLALLNFNAAGPYPSCFENLTSDQKTSEHRRILDRNLDHMFQLARLLDPKYVLPFAGAFVLGGRQWRKNACLGTTTSAKAADYLASRFAVEQIAVKAIDLTEGMWISLDDGSVGGAEYRPADEAAQRDYIADVLSRCRYEWENDPEPAPAELAEKLCASRRRLWKAQQSFGYFPGLNVYIATGAPELFAFKFDRPDVRFTATLEEPMLVCSMDLRLLSRILRRDAHWNNAEIGCHIEFRRAPNVYLPDVHMLLSMFHA